jgi:predicted nucleotidyltransferase
MTSIFEDRRNYSEQRIAQLRDEIGQAVIGIDLPDLAIFTVGSYGRSEASPHSDIDLFFTYQQTISSDTRRTNEYRLFGRLIDLVDGLGYPPLSNDAEFLRTQDLQEMLADLGSPNDDHKNYFTSRMLLLLESKPLYGTENYDAIIGAIIEAYYRDYPKHSDKFRAWFLLNDIMRFWKTLLLNYENKRNRGRDEDPEADVRARVKNFKLKFSRATTCFATICAIGSFGDAVDQETIKEIVSVTPRERLELVRANIPSLDKELNDVLESYAWFLGQTASLTEELRDRFRDSVTRSEMFERADSYADQLFELISGIDSSSESDLLRALVV